MASAQPKVILGLGLDCRERAMARRRSFEQTSQAGLAKLSWPGRGRHLLKDAIFALVVHDRLDDLRGDHRFLACEAVHQGSVAEHVDEPGCALRGEADEVAGLVGEKEARGSRYPEAVVNIRRHVFAAEEAKVKIGGD